MPKTANDLAAVFALYPDAQLLLACVVKLRYADEHLRRVEAKWERNAVSTSIYDKAKTAHHAAQSMVFQAEARLRGEIQ
jgi:hypothetical protein